MQYNSCSGYTEAYGTGARRLTLTVSPTQAGRTVDDLMRQELGLSGTGVKRAKSVSGGILLDGEAVYVSRRTAQGQTLSVLVGDQPDENGLQPVPGPVEVAYEDEDLLIVSKSPGVAVHPGPGHFDDTLGNFVTWYYLQHGIHAVFRPVNRLDRGTSGLLVLAKHAHAQERLKQALHSAAFRRVYLAVCDGSPPVNAGIIDTPIGRVEGSTLRREVRADGACAVTQFRLLRTLGTRSLLRLELETGRTHQIRVHLAYLGCPITGDFLYGQEQPMLIGRTALHSALLELCHPVTGQILRITAPLPMDMRQLLTRDVLMK